MLVTLDMGQILTFLANAFIIIGGIYAFWRFLKREWKKPDPPAQ